LSSLGKRGTFVPVWREIMADLLTPVSAFLKIAEHSDYAFLLESVEGGEQVGRYSFLGKDPFLILRGREGETSIEQSGERTRRDEPCLEVLRQLMAEFSSPIVPDLPRFTWRRRRVSRLRRRRVVRACGAVAEATGESRYGRVHGVRYRPGL
jgi:anthranilate synthase component 1